MAEQLEDTPCTEVEIENNSILGDDPIVAGEEAIEVIKTTEVKMNY